MKTIPAIFFPTSVLMVDDDLDFVRSLLLNLSTERSFYQIYGEPVSCLTRLNAEFRPDPFEMNWVARGEDFYFEHRMMDVNIPDLRKEVYNQNRFEQISVIVVDYHMPGMNGLEFCANIKNKFVRKILLTGQTDESIAVDAFNKGLIHKYVRKHDPNLAEVLNRAIAEAQHDYFCNLTQDINRTVLLPPEDTALSDSRFIDFLIEHRQAFKAVEHYLCEATGSFLFFNAQGESIGVSVALDPMIDSLLEIAGNDVSPSLIADLQNRKKMLCFHGSNGHALPHGSQWEKFAYPAIRVEGKQTYYCAMSPSIFEMAKWKIKAFSPPVRNAKRRKSSEQVGQPLTSRQSELHSLNC